MPVVALLISEGVNSPQHQKLVRGVCLDSIFKREDGGRAMLAEQPEVLFTHPTTTGHYDKIGRPSKREEGQRAGGPLNARMDKGRAMLAVQPEVLFTHPTTEGIRICMRLCACACPGVCVCACVCASDCARACACVTVCGVCVRVCVVKSWWPGLRSMCVCVCDNVKPCCLESTPGRKRERTPRRGHTRLNPPPQRATRG